MDVSRDQIPALTGVRAIAAWMVFCYHYHPPVFGVSFVQPIFGEMHVGVTMFYVLSGFLITARFLGRSGSDPRWLGTYIQFRVARIYPVYLAVLTLSMLAHVIRGSANWTPTRFVCRALFLTGFSEAYHFDWAPQMWSLTVEETFYILAPLLFICLRRGRPGVFLLAVYAAGVILWAIARQVDSPAFLGGARFMLLYTFFGRVLEFFLGALLARRLLTAGPFRVRGLALAGAGGILVVCFLLSRLPGAPGRLSLEQPLGLLLNHLALPLAMVALIHGLIFERGPLAAILGSRPLTLLGNSSYSFYLIHVGIFSTLYEKILHFDRWPLFLALNATAVALYLGFEKPMQRLIRGWSGWRSRN